MSWGTCHSVLLYEHCIYGVLHALWIGKSSLVTVHVSPSVIHRTGHLGAIFNHTCIYLVAYRFEFLSLRSRKDCAMGQNCLGNDPKQELHPLLHLQIL